MTESYVNPHLHLCKVWTLRMMAEDALTSYHADGMANSLSAIDLASKIKEKYDASWIIPERPAGGRLGGAPWQPAHPRLCRRGSQGAA